MKTEIDKLLQDEFTPVRIRLYIFACASKKLLKYQNLTF